MHSVSDFPGGCPFRSLTPTPWRPHPISVRTTQNPAPRSNHGLITRIVNIAKHCMLFLQNTWTFFFHLGDLAEVLIETHLGHPEDPTTVKRHHSILRDTLLITDPYFSEAILSHVNNDVDPQGAFSGGINRWIVARMAGDHNLATCPSDEHARLRPFFEPFFSYQAMSKMAPRFFKDGIEFLQGWLGGQLGQPINITEGTDRFGLIAIAHTFLGIQTPPEQLQRAFDTIARYGVADALLPIKFPRIRNRLAEANEVVRSAIQEVIRTQNDPDNLIVAMQRQGLTQDQIFDMVRLVFFAGQKNISAILTFAIWQLGQQQNTVWRNQIRTEWAHRDPDAPLSAALDSCPTLVAVIKESLRLNPVVQVQSRLAKNNLIIRNEETRAELFVQAGMTLNCDHYVSMRRSACWGPNVHQFDPSRHRASSADEYRRMIERQGPWLPFGGRGSPNRCLAEQFAMMQFKVLLLLMVEHYDWTVETVNVKQTGTFGCRIEADHQTGWARWFIQKMTGTSPSSDVFVRFAQRS